jgi:dTDP-4-dehydrorhamnose reductase
MKAVVLGAGGQVGRALLAAIPTGVEADPLPHCALDIADSAALEETLQHLQPEVVINAAGYTAVDRAEVEQELAFAANARGVAHLARACARRRIRLVHVSTDHVFDGKASRPYGTADGCAPINFYGVSKLAGERAAGTHPGALVVRSSRIYSRHGRNFVRAVIARFRDARTVHAVRDQFAAPTSASCLARYLWRVAMRPEITGVRHWTDAGEASWYDWACAIRSEALALGLLKQAAEPVAISSVDYPTAARRPCYSVLDTERSACEVDLEPLPWRTGLRAVLVQMQHESGALEAPGLLGRS